MLLLPFKAMLPLGHARKSGGPPLFEPSFKVQGENAHNQSSGFRAAPGLENLNARGPLKVHGFLAVVSRNQRWRAVRWPGLPGP
jgi:hypothetical protein